MLKYNNTHIFTGYLKQLLSKVNIPTCRIYTREFAKYLETNGVEDPRVLESFDSISSTRASVRFNYIKDNGIYNYFWKYTNTTDLGHSNATWEKNDTHFFSQDKNIHGLTKTLHSYGHYYDSTTHEYLGDYLRFLRDYHNINLMPLYNCFNDKIYSNISYKKANIDFQSQNPKYRIYAIPVKLFANYTIAIDCNHGVELFCGFYNTKLDTSDRADDLIVSTYQKVNKTLFNQPFLYSKLDFTNWSFETATAEVKYDNIDQKKLLVPNKITRWDIANREQDLKLFIKVPTSCKSSIVILEGDYRTYNDTKYAPPGRFNVYSELFTPSEDNSFFENLEVTRTAWEYKQNHSVLNFGNKEYPVDLNDSFVPIGKLQLLSFNTGESYPFADRLIEYLAGSAITPIDEIPDNIKRAQKVMKYNGHHFVIDGLWEDKMQRIIYDYMVNSGPIVYDGEKLIDKHRGYHKALGKRSKSLLYDVLGYVDRDAEKWYASWTKPSDALASSKPVVKNTIQNVDIYNGLFDIQ